jgi:hypothetical protein
MNLVEEKRKRQLKKRRERNNKLSISTSKRYVSLPKKKQKM